MKKIKKINPADIPAEYLQKYQKSGPRYTSYPTAPHFRPGFNPEDLKTLWEKTNLNRDSGLSIYTHFPFCKSRCYYCGCFTHINKSRSIQERYVEALKKETEHIFSILDPSRKVGQLAFGGGTPTHLKKELLSDYINHLDQIVDFSDIAERSIELDPRSVDEDYLYLLLETGFNRFSFGVQDLDDMVQKNINRVTDEKKLKSFIDLLLSNNMEAINLDLIYGLPGQTPYSFGETIRKIIRLKPSRIALFGYAHVPWASPHQKAMEKHPIPSTKERMILFGNAFQLLTDEGYKHVGMDHFALPGDELILALENRTLTRNFMGYTTRRGMDLVGLGASSISSVGSTYTQNRKDLEAYIDNKDGNHWEKALILSTEDHLRREIILELFCNFHLDINLIEEKFSILFEDHFAQELEALKPLEADKLITVGKKELIVSELGRFFIRNICMVFDKYLQKEKHIPEKRYSKTL